MSNELSLTFKDLSSMAQVMSRSGLFGKKPDEMLSLMLLAQAQGQHPATVAMEYDVIQGRPAINARSAQARFQAAGGKVQWLERSDLKASAKFYHEAGGELVITWTMDRAKQAGLTGKDNWRKYPAQMLSARVIAEGVRAVFPACLSGFYTVEELNDIPSDIPALNATPEPKKAAPVETAVEVIDEDVKAAMTDPLEDRINKMLDYMQAAGISEQNILEYTNKKSIHMLDEQDISGLSLVVRECTKFANESSEPIDVILRRHFNVLEKTNESL